MHPLFSSFLFCFLLCFSQSVICLFFHLSFISVSLNFSFVSSFFFLLGLQVSSIFLFDFFHFHLVLDHLLNFFTLFFFNFFNSFHFLSHHRAFVLVSSSDLRLGILLGTIQWSWDSRLLPVWLLTETSTKICCLILSWRRWICWIHLFGYISRPRISKLTFEYFWCLNKFRWPKHSNIHLLSRRFINLPRIPFGRLRRCKMMFSSNTSFWLHCRSSLYIKTSRVKFFYWNCCHGISKSFFLISWNI